MRQRDHEGYVKYSVRLQPHNGRNALQDAYEEALDLVVYLRQAIEERKIVCECRSKGADEGVHFSACQRSF